MHVAYNAHVNHVLFIAFVRNKNYEPQIMQISSAPLFYILFLKSKYSSLYPAITRVHGSFLVCGNESSV